MNNTSLLNKIDEWFKADSSRAIYAKHGYILFASSFKNYIVKHWESSQEVGRYKTVKCVEPGTSLNSMIEIGLNDWENI